MRFHITAVHRLCLAVAAAIILLWLHSLLRPQAAPPPLNTINHIARYELAGIRLGMTETQAVAAVRDRFPPGQLHMSDYELTDPKTRERVRAGVRFDLHPQGGMDQDFIKILTHAGRVWAVWRDDSSATYEYDSLYANVISKYRGASPQSSPFVVVTKDLLSQEPGPRTVSGVARVDGQCPDLPLTVSPSDDKVSLGSQCRKFFAINYQPQITNGMRLLTSGRAQLVDAEVGRAFIAWMASGKGNIPGDQRHPVDITDTTHAKL